MSELKPRKRLPICEKCKQIAKEEHSIHKISESYLYKILREKCEHTKAGDTNDHD